MKIWYWLVTLLYDESQAHLPAFPKQENRKHDELRYVTARVAHRPHTLTFTYKRVRSARTPPSTFLFLPIQLSNSKGKVQTAPSGRTVLNQVTGLHPDTETLSPRFAQ